ncbi:MAG: HAMP domain-containing sensor histidine kinase, partial [Campylobacterota bacterium]|nr:HAMP domain-containing sensor histidine kinase [Campylobacterota bacterium]
TPLEEDFAANNAMRNKILIFIAAALFLLVVYYSMILAKRENELLSANDILDAKVKEEVAKNTQKEMQLIQQSRTAAMGEMMGAIIHQWKQPLNTISIANSSIDMHIIMDDFDKEIFTKQTESIKAQIEYMNITMNDFRDFFITKEKSCFDMSQCVVDVQKLIGKIYEIQKINIISDLQDDLIVSGYSNELNQVIINILNNARDIIKETEPEIKDIFVRSYQENGSAYITITDCAGGVPEDIIDNIFEPYFTTKDDDKGTGIGLDMSMSIVQKVDGDLSVENVTTTIDGKEYKGAQFTIMMRSCKEEDK